VVDHELAVLGRAPSAGLAVGLPEVQNIRTPPSVLYSSIRAPLAAWIRHWGKGDCHSSPCVSTADTLHVRP
jgi:hypothetical protein